MNNYDLAYQKLLQQNLTVPELISFVEENSRSLKTHLDKVLDTFNTRVNEGSRKAIELGCGGGAISSYLSTKGFETTGLDISRKAIELAIDLKNALNSNSRFIVFDVCQNTELTEKFDLVIDSHLLHCLYESEQRARYYQFVKNNISGEGLFLGECMSFHRDLKIPVDYHLEENGVLHRGEKPIRLLMDSHGLEKELLSAGFKIEYYYYHSELSFEVYPEFPNFPPEYLPKTIRFAASLNS